jgi:hypothetical protein
MSSITKKTRIFFGKLKGQRHEVLLLSEHKGYVKWLRGLENPKTIVLRTLEWLKKFDPQSPIPDTSDPRDRDAIEELSYQDYDQIGSCLLEDLSIQDIRSYLKTRLSRSYVHKSKQIDQYEYKL